MNKTNKRFRLEKTPLMYATGEGRFDVVKYLMALTSARKNIVSEQHFTMLVRGVT